MVTAFGLALAQLGDPRILRVLRRSLLVTLALFAALGAGVWYGTDTLLAGQAWHGSLASAAALVVTILALWLAFRAVAILVVGVFADEIVAAVETRHYPAALDRARPVALHRSLRMGLGSAARFVALNALLLPAYVVLLATGVGTAALFFAANGWLLGRDLMDMVAARHMDDAAMRAWRRTTRGDRLALGLAGTGLFVVPVANLVAPVLGAAMATHMFHRGRR